MKYFNGSPGIIEFNGTTPENAKDYSRIKKRRKKKPSKESFENVWHLLLIELIFLF